jgi:hypothetical protein
MLMCNWCNSITLYEFEGTFDPAYLNLDANNRDAWKIYAEKVRNIIAKVLDIPKTKMNYQDNKDCAAVLYMI